MYQSTQFPAREEQNYDHLHPIHHYMEEPPSINPTNLNIKFYIILPNDERSSLTITVQQHLLYTMSFEELMSHRCL